jgi:Protein of unknown function (DUF2851)
MNEKLLQYIWQYRYFNQSDLCLDSGERLQIIFAGLPNQNQGPDFLDARIKIESTLWIGHVEIHLQTSDWYKHVHDEDRNYDNVILHVVMENDYPMRDEKIPLLVLSQRIPRLLLAKCEEWMNSQAFIPCAGTASQVDGQVWQSWKNKMVLERLERKAEELLKSLEQNNFHWEQIFWWKIAANFGFRVNAIAFESIAKTLSLNLLARHKNQFIQLEALLMGQAGLLNRKFSDSYPQMLKKEYQFLKIKYQLKPVFEAIHFLRMRPRNFPTLRLSQLAALIHRSNHLFSVIREIKDLPSLRSFLNVSANDYWNRHYRFDEESVFVIKSLGAQMIDNLLINTIVPILYSYGWFHKNEELQERALRWMDEIPAENNSIIERWKKLGIGTETAISTQALLELKSQYCDNRKCLGCSIGNAVLKKLV